VKDYFHILLGIKNSMKIALKKNGNFSKTDASSRDDFDWRCNWSLWKI